MSENNEKKDLIKSSDKVPDKINLGPNTTMDLSFLPEKERKELLVNYSKGMLDIGIKAQELHVDATILKKTLEDLADATGKVSEKGDAVTITHTQNTKVGRTEVMMGNTVQAQKGKFSKSQTGERDWTPYYIFAGIVALIIIFSLVYK